MNTYAFLFLNRLKIQFRVIGYYFLFPVAFFLLTDITSKAPELLLSLTGYVTQSLIFIGLIMGYHGGLRDIKQAGEYILIQENSFVAHMLAVLAEVCFILLIQVVFYLYIAILGIYYQQAAWYFKETFLYLVLYYFLPMTLGDIIGHIVSLRGEKPILYFVLIIIGLLIGPSGRRFMEDFASLLLGDEFGFYLVNLINIGQIDIGEGMDLFYGLQIEQQRFWHVLMFLFGAMCIYAVLYLIRYVRKKKFRMVIFPMLCLMSGGLCLWLYLKPCYVPTSESSDNALSISYYDRLYYRDKTELKMDGSFEISAMKADIDTRRHFLFDGEIKGKICKNTEEIAFRLYHDLKVKKIFGENITGYFQNEDTVYIYYNKELRNGEVVDFHITYEGNSSPYFYVNERAVFLPAFFNYLPCPGEGYAMMTSRENAQMEKLKPVPTYIGNEVNYDLQIKGNYDIYTNLQEIEKNHYVGSTDQGVYMISNDHMKVYKFKDFEIISCIKMTDEFAEYAGGSLVHSVQESRTEKGQKAQDRYTVILVPHHTLLNTILFDYADEQVIYSDAKTWSILTGYRNMESVDNIMRKKAESAAAQFEER